jgi:hypothetical protein
LEPLGDVPAASFGTLCPPPLQPENAAIIAPTIANLRNMRKPVIPFGCGLDLSGGSLDRAVYRERRASRDLRNM